MKIVFTLELMYSVFSGVKAKTLVCEIEMQQVRAVKWTVFFFAH